MYFQCNIHSVLKMTSLMEIAFLEIAQGNCFNRESYNLKYIFLFCKCRSILMAGIVFMIIGQM